MNCGLLNTHDSQNWYNATPLIITPPCTNVRSLFTISLKCAPPYEHPARLVCTHIISSTSYPIHQIKTNGINGKAKNHICCSSRLQQISKPQNYIITWAGLYWKYNHGLLSLLVFPPSIFTAMSEEVAKVHLLKWYSRSYLYTLHSSSRLQKKMYFSLYLFNNFSY